MLYVREEFVDKTQGIRYHAGEVLESFTDDTGELYRACVREYGRCAGKVFVGEKTHVGWIFEKRVQYDDCEQTFLREAWITVHQKTPTVSTQYHYVSLK